MDLCVAEDIRHEDFPPRFTLFLCPTKNVNQAFFSGGVDKKSGFFPNRLPFPALLNLTINLKGGIFHLLFSILVQTFILIGLTTYNHVG